MSTGPDQSTLIDEQLSAWLDDELPAAELELLASRLARSPEHRARLARYGLIGGVLRGGQAGAATPGLAVLQVSARVSAALDGVAVPAAQSVSRTASRWLPYAAAAGVALVAVALVPLLRPAPGSAPAPATAFAVQATRVPAAIAPVRAQSLVAARGVPPGQPSLSPRRLTSYLVYHGEYSGMLSAKLTDSHIVNNRSYAVVVTAPDQLAVR